jgi:hypothetical protein
MNKGYLVINTKKVKNREKIAATIKGAFKFGEKLRILPKIDLVVEGS